ncbi:hypothetical protein B9Z55_022762 [Caenorhabditis nigoni]|uniref:Uncharacterized protein n=1 Tax=Caenorhabditis nigoni TaxID=1611254 RepID=A0A2G5SM45_9PELO|nr:hypothetical protein B9Z55_022762 [Caenorhabditis nigoni]
MFKTNFYPDPPNSNNRILVRHCSSFPSKTFKVLPTRQCLLVSASLLFPDNTHTYKLGQAAPNICHIWRRRGKHKAVTSPKRENCQMDTFPIQEDNRIF